MLYSEIKNAPQENISSHCVLDVPRGQGIKLIHTVFVFCLYSFPLITAEPTNLGPILTKQSFSYIE